MSQSKQQSRSGEGRSTDTRSAQKLRDKNIPNPFLDDDHTTVLPSYKDPEGKKTYRWIRTAIGGHPDSRNVHAANTGRLRWFPVSPDELPEEFKALVLSSSMHGAGAQSVVQINDVTLFWADAFMRGQFIDAVRIKSENQRFSGSRFTSAANQAAGGKTEIKIEDADAATETETVSL